MGDETAITTVDDVKSISTTLKKHFSAIATMSEKSPAQDIIFNIFLAVAYPKMKAKLGAKHKIHRDVILEMTGYSHHDIERLDEEVIRLQKINYVFREKDKKHKGMKNIKFDMMALSLVSMVQRIGAYYYFRFVPELEEIYYNPKVYGRVQTTLKLDGVVLRKLQRLYEYCSRWVKGDKWDGFSEVVTHEMWLWLTHTEDSQFYRGNWRKLREKKIVPMINEINETTPLDIKIHESVKTGRKVTGTILYVTESENEQQTLPLQIDEVQAIQETNNPLIDKLISIDSRISRKKAGEWLVAVGEDKFLELIQWFPIAKKRKEKEGDPLQNPNSYIRQTVQSFVNYGSWNLTMETKDERLRRRKKEAQARKVEIDKEKIRKNEEKVKEVLKNREESRKKVMDFLSQATPEEVKKFEMSFY